jgi:hypothetical protein
MKLSYSFSVSYKAVQMLTCRGCTYLTLHFTVLAMAVLLPNTETETETRNFLWSQIIKLPEIFVWHTFSFV